MNTDPTLWILISVLRRVVFRRHDETATFPGAAEYRLDDIDELLPVLHRPVDLVVVPRSEIDHDVLVTIEEHRRARVVQLVHLVKVRHFGDVDKEYNGEVFDLLGDLVQRLVHDHARGVPVVTEAYDDDAIFLREYRLVDLPAVVEVL